jgi:hypothetical protein
MSSEYDSTTAALLAQATRAVALASGSAGRINLATKPTLKETSFTYTPPTIALGAPPKFSDLFDGADNSGANYNVLNDQVDAWLAKYFPAINGSFKTLPEDYAANIISGVKPYGSDTTVFERVWSRMRDRTYRTAHSELRTAEARFSNQGFSLPPGAMVAAQADIERRATEAILEVNVEQAVKEADICKELLMQAVQIAAQLKLGILNTSAEFFRAYYGLKQLDVDSARIRAQAYQSFYSALSTYYDVEVAQARLQLQARETRAQVDSSIDRNRVGIYGANGVASAHAQASRGFSDIAAQSAAAAGTLVAQIESV